MTNFVRILYAIRSRFLTGDRSLFLKERERKRRGRKTNYYWLLTVKDSRDDNEEKQRGIIIAKIEFLAISVPYPQLFSHPHRGGGVSSPQNIQQRRTSIAQLGNSIQPSCIAALRHEAATLPLTDYDRGTILCSRPGNCCVHPR